MIRTVVSRLGALALGADAERAGFVPGAVVLVSRLSTGSLLVTLDDDQSAYDVPFRAVDGRRAILGRRGNDGSAP